MRTALGFCCAAVCGCALALPAHAGNGIEDIAVTVRQLGRGGAFIAAEPDVGALMGNPAALAFMEGAELYVDARVWHSTLDYQGALNGLGQKENYTLPNIGYAERAGERFAWGAGVFTAVNSAFRVTDYDLSVVGAPPGTVDRTSVKARFVLFSPGFAYKLSDDTSIGAALHYTSGTADFQAYDILGSTLGYSLDKPHGEGWAARAGIFHRAGEDTALGAYWRSRTHLDITDGVLTIAPGFTQQGALAPIPGTSIEGFQFPEQYGIGVSHQLDCEWTALAEYRRLLWSGNDETISFVPPQGEPLGLAMDWLDQDVYVLGAEYRPRGTDETVWRLGMNYAKSPVPDETLSPLYPAISEWHYTAGWEQELSEGFSLVTGAVYTPEVTRLSSADNTFNQLLGAGQPYSLSHGSWQLGVGLSWTFGGDCDEECEEEAPRCGCDGCIVVPDGADGCRTYSALCP